MTRETPISPPSGWYTAPDDPTQYRYWDGRAWAEDRTEAPSPGRKRGRLHLGIAIALDGLGIAMGALYPRLTLLEAMGSRTLIWLAVALFYGALIVACWYYWQLGPGTRRFGALGLVSFNVFLLSSALFMATVGHVTLGYFVLAVLLWLAVLGSVVVANVIYAVRASQGLPDPASSADPKVPDAAPAPRRLVSRRAGVLLTTLALVAGLLVGLAAANPSRFGVLAFGFPTGTYRDPYSPVTVTFTNDGTWEVKSTTLEPGQPYDGNYILDGHYVEVSGVFPNCLNDGPEATGNGSPVYKWAWNGSRLKLTYVPPQNFGTDPPRDCPYRRELLSYLIPVK